MTREEPRAGGAPPIDTVDAVIVGAGFAGHVHAAPAAQLGFTAVVYEAADGVGGTWYWNRYPGARCDVESINYSYSLRPRARAGVGVERALRHAAGDPALRQPRRRPLRPAPRHPVRHPGDGGRLRRGGRALERHHRPGRRRLGAVPRDGGRLPVDVQDAGDPRRRRVPRQRYHTGHWPHEGVDFTGQRVGVIGTGSSAIQSIPIIAEQAAHLTVFQRTPNFSLPAENAPLDPDEFDGELKARYPEHRRRPATSAFGVPNPLPEKSALEVDRRRARGHLRGGFEKGSLVGMLLAYNDLITDKAANDTAAEFVRKRIRRDRRGSRRRRGAVRRPITRSAPSGRASTPTTTRRTTAPTSQLVDLRKTPLVEITETRRAHDGARVRVRRDRVRHRLRRHDRRAGGVRHQGSRRRDAEGEVGRRARAPTSASPSPGSPTCS